MNKIKDSSFKKTGSKSSLLEYICEEDCIVVQISLSQFMTMKVSSIPWLAQWSIIRGEGFLV